MEKQKEHVIDMDLLTASETVQWLEKDLKRHDKPLFITYLQHLAYKDVDMKILEFRKGEKNITPIIMDSFGRGPSKKVESDKFYNHDVIEDDSEVEILLGIVAKNLDHNKPPAQAKHDKATLNYDLIFILGSSAHAADYVREARRLQSPRGRILCIGNPLLRKKGSIHGPAWTHFCIEQCTSDTTFANSICLSGAWNLLWREDDFSKNPTTFTREEESHESDCHNVPVDSVLNSERRFSLREAIILVNGKSERQQAFGETLRSQLENRTGLKSSTVDFCSFADHEKFHQALCISLFGLDDSFLYAISSEDFVKIKSLFFATRNLLWVGASGGRAPASPSFDLFDVFSRSMRLEINDLKLVSVAFEKNKRSIVNMAKKVVGVVQQDFCDAVYSAKYEREHIDFASRLHIKRVREDAKLNKIMEGKHSQRKIELVKPKHFGAVELAMVPRDNRKLT